MFDTELEIKRRINCIVRDFKFDLYKYIEEKFTRNEGYRRSVLSTTSSPSSPTSKELADKIFPLDEKQYTYKSNSSMSITPDFESMNHQELRKRLNENRDNKKFISDNYTTLERKIDEYFDDMKEMRM